MAESWPFEEPESTAVFTTTRVLHQGRPILLVTHDDDDGAWCFLDGGDFSEANGMLVSLRAIVRDDPSVRELASLPLGWAAWRPSARDPWQWVRQGEEQEPEPAPLSPQAWEHAGAHAALDPLGFGRLAGLVGPCLEHDGWELDSAEERHRAYPDTFPIPEPAARATLKPGDLVKLLFLVAPGADAEGPACERMWVKVIEAGLTGYLGVLDNDPVVAKGLKAGDLVPFRPEHVAAVWED